MSSRRHPLLLLVCVLMACGKGASREGFAPEIQAINWPAWHIYDHMDEIEVGGMAKLLADGTARGTPVPVLAVNFEDGTLGPLVPFAGVDKNPAALGEAVVVVSGEEASGGGKSVRLKGPTSSGLSLRSVPIPVNPSTSYELSYKIAGQKIMHQSKSSYGAASIVVYKIPKDAQGNVSEYLADPAKELEARVKVPEEFWTPDHYGTLSWTTDKDTFGTGPSATHMVVSFDLSRPNDDRAPHKTAGVVWFDDILLTATSEPAALRHVPHSDTGMGKPHPLKVLVSRWDPKMANSDEQRYALSAPAPSDLAFKVKMPPAAHLQLGYALLPEANTLEREEVKFSVLVKAPAGEKTVWEGTYRCDTEVSWKDAEVDLSEFEGQDVTVILRTTGRDSSDPARDVLRMPESGAVWGYPILYSERHPGKTIVMVVSDTLAVGHSSTFGYAKDTTPNLTRIAKEGTRFDRAVSPAPWTLPSFSSLLTGLDPSRHRAGERLYGAQQWRRPLATTFVTIQERLRAAGWQTSAWINNPYLTPDFGLDQGFSRLLDYGTRSVENGSAPAVEDLEKYLASPRGYDRFLFIHLMDPHGPYRPNREYRNKWLTDGYQGRFEEKMTGQDYLDMCEGKLELNDQDKVRVGELYDAVVNYMDHQLGVIFDLARKSSRPESFTFIFTADHGEEQWEHGRYEHGHSMYDELLHVPLVVYQHGKGKGGRRVNEVVSSHDVAPTILEAAGLPVPEEFRVTSLLKWLDGEAPPSDRAFFGQQMLYGTQRISVEQSGWKYLYNEANTGAFEKRAGKPKVRHELYNLPKDHTEQNNLFTEELDRALNLHEQLALHFSESLAGRFVVYFDSGTKDLKAFKGTATLPPSSQWMRFTEDYLWPGPAGRAGKVDFRQTRASDEAAGMEFSAQAPRGIIGLTIDKGVSPVTFTLELDGVPLTPEQIFIGRDGTHPTTVPFSVDEKMADIRAHEILKASAVAGPRVVIGFLAETPELLEEKLSGMLSEDLEEQLRALGYIH